MKIYLNIYSGIKKENSYQLNLDNNDIIIRVSYFFLFDSFTMMDLMFVYLMAQKCTNQVEYTNP